MKKVVLFLASVILLGIIVSSCSTGTQCAAYGEARNYRVERR
ncbi:MAG: hypothetical protein ACOYMF_07655 [Bacteroidales bacterium]